MVDEKKTVELEVTANTTQAEQQLDKIATKAQTIGTTDKKYAEIAQKHQQQTKKFTDKINDPQKRKKLEGSSEKMLDHEKERLKLLEKQNKELEKYERTQNKIVQNNKNKGKGGGGGDGGSSGADLMKSIKGKLGLAAIAIAGSIVGTVAKQMSQGYDAYVEYGKSKIGLAGMGATDQSLDALRDTSQEKYAYTGVETMEQAAGVGRATGQYGSVGEAQALTRGTSMQMDESIGIMQTMTQAGTGFGGQAGKKGFRELKQAVALGFNAGMDDARLPEYLRGVQQVVTAQGGRTAGEVSFTEYGKMFAALGRGGGPGWQGDRGAAMFQRLNEGIVNPGGGEAGQALTLQAMGFGTPGGDATYYEALKKQQEGATPENVRRVIEMTGMQAGSGEEEYLTLATQLNMRDNLDAVEKMVEVVRSQDSGEMTDEKLQALINETGTAEDRAAAELEGIGSVLSDSVGLQNRLIKIGQDNYQAVLNLILATNKGVDELLPAGNAALNAISNSATYIARIMSGEDEYDPTAGVRTGMGGMPHIDRKAGLGLGPDFDPTYVAGQQDMSEAKRQAIAKIFQANPEAKTMGHRNLQDVYKQMTSGEKGGPSKSSQIAMMEKLFGPGGEFEGRMNELITAAASTAQSAAKAVEATAEAQRLNNSGPAVSTVPPDQLESVQAPGVVY